MDNWWPHVSTAELADGLQKRLASRYRQRFRLYLNDGNLGVGGGVVAVEAALDLVGDVRDHLNCASAKVARGALSGVRSSKPYRW